MDLYSRRIIGWEMNHRMTQDLIIQALKQSINHLPLQLGLIYHSNRGSEYAATDYQKLMEKCGTRTSMSRKDNFYDNACMY